MPSPGHVCAAAGWGGASCGRGEKAFGTVGAARRPSGAPYRLGETPSVVGRKRFVPGRMPSIPERMPSVPGGMPSIPGGTPSIPGGMPSIPGRMPSIPGGMPSVPGGMPSVPGGTPSVPGGTPSIPGEMPSIPEENAPGPGVKPAARRGMAKLSISETDEVADVRIASPFAIYRAIPKACEIPAVEMNFVDIHPASDSEGFSVHVGDAPPVRFEQEHLAIGYAQEAFPAHAIRIFAADHIIARIIPPRV